MSLLYSQFFDSIEGFLLPIKFIINYHSNPNAKMDGKMREIISDIVNHVNGEAYSKWYIGITKDVNSRLFGDHNVDEKTDRWIWRLAANENEARDIEKYFLNLGMSGGGGGGDHQSKYVYAYRKSYTTRP